MEHFFRKDLIKKNENKILVERKKNTLALNESSLSFLSLITEEEKQRILNSPINKYPTEEFLVEINEKIKNYCGLKHTNQILIGNGIDDLLYYLFISINEKNSKCIINVPTYPDYKNYGESIGLSFIEIPLIQKILKKDETKVSEVYRKNENINEEEFTFQLDVNKIIKTGKKKEVKAIIFTNPNNPTGSVFPISDIIYISEKLSNKIIIIDEAYIEFCPENSLVPLIDEFTNIIILRTFSKGFLSPGLRLGYLISNSNTISNLKKVFPVFPVSQVSIEIGKILLQNYEKIKDIRQNIINNREKIYNKLYKLKKTGQLENVYKSNTNFILFQFNNEKEMNELYNFLLKNEISVRNVSSKYLKNSLRVTSSNDFETEEFINKIEQYFV